MAKSRQKETSLARARFLEERTAVITGRSLSGFWPGPDGGSWHQHVNRANAAYRDRPESGSVSHCSAFFSLLRICPDPKISGGQVLSSRTRPTKNRAALALRMATQGLHRSDTFLGDYFRRMKARMGVPKAMTATAHKLARIVYHMITTRQEYDSTIFQQQEQRRSQQRTARLHAQARMLGFHLVPIDFVP